MMMQDDRRVAVKYDTVIWVQAGTGGLWYENRVPDARSMIPGEAQNPRNSG